MKGSRNVGLLIVFLLIAVAMAVAFFPGVNENVARGMAEIVPIDTASLDGATQTIKKPKPTSSMARIWMERA